MGQDKQYDAIRGKTANEAIGHRCRFHFVLDRLDCLVQRGRAVL